MEYQSVLKIVFGIVLIVAYLFIFYNFYEAYEESKDNKNITPKEEINNFKESIEKQSIENEWTEFVESEDSIIENPNAELVSLGKFKLTAYCPCDICCGEWANRRPNGVIFGAIGEELKEGYSIAVDPKVIPYRTEVIINGNTYKAQDCGGAIKGNRIDIYFSDHQKALEFGVQYAEVYMAKDYNE